MESINPRTGNTYVSNSTFSGSILNAKILHKKIIYFDVLLVGDAPKKYRKKVGNLSFQSMYKKYVTAYIILPQIYY